MGFACGIVGLPNVGKSTTFNALGGHAEAANYPFCTKDPNVAIVSVPDDRLEKLAAIVHPERIVPATIRFVDIAGLVRGASKGEGMGNQFLSHIREVDAIAHVVRCFEDGNIVHVDNKVDPVADVHTIDTELALRDLESVEKRLERARKMVKAGSPVEKAAIPLCEALAKHLDAGLPARTFELPDDPHAPAIFRELWLLTAKPLFYVANVAESALSRLEEDAHLRALVAHAAKEGAQVVPISAAIEAQIAELPPEDRGEFLASAGLVEPGLHNVIRAGYELLGLATYFTAGKLEVRAWTIRKGALAPEAAGVIHTDFERTFIRAEVIWWEDFVALGGESKCRDAGKMGIEGKEYVVRDGDVMHFRTSA